MIPDLKPFAVDPLLLKPLNDAGASAFLVTLLVTGVTVLSLVWTAAAAKLLLWPAGSRTVGQDISLFIFRRPSGDESETVPYLRDYPSLVLTFTIVSAVCLVYSLFRGAAKLHSDLDASGAIKYDDEAARLDLAKRVREVNESLARWGKFSPLALAASIGFVLLVNISMQGGLFSFLGSDLYPHWWAAVSPLRPGGVVWVLFGGIGIYMVYVEAVLGLTYVNFLRRLRGTGDYKFKANMLNPDGFFGFRRLRSLITNMQAGAMCTLLSAWSFSFFLEPAAGLVPTIVVLAIFIGVVTYVYLAVNSNFRRQVRNDKRAQAEEVAEEIARYSHAADEIGLLRMLVAYRRLELIAKIPSTPIRQSWLLAGTLSLIGTVAAVVAPLLQYFTQ
jgi:hypothetical protein